MGQMAASGDAPRTSQIVMTVLVPFGIGYYLSYLLRTVNAVIAPRLTVEVGLTPADLGFLTSIYFATFAAAQLPLGVALDRYGPRRVQMVLLLVAAFGAALFSLGESFAVLAFARGCIGLGVAGCLMSSFKINAMWWPPARLALTNNLIVTFGSVGALSATAPVEALLHVTGWRELFAAAAVATVGVAALMAFVVPERKDGVDRFARLGEQIAALKQIYASGYFWRVGLMLIACTAVLLSYQTLWAGPWLADVAGLGRQAVAEHLFLLQLGMFAGVLLTGLGADFLGRSGIGPGAMVGITMALFIGVQALLALGATTLAPTLWAAFGFFGAGSFLCFALYGAHFAPALTGRVSTAANTLIFVLTFATQWAIGGIIGAFAPVAEGAYPPEAHQTALWVVIVVQLAALVWYLLPRPRPRHG